MQKLMERVLWWLVLGLGSILGAARAEAGSDAERGDALWNAWEIHRAMADGSIFRGLPWRSVGPVDQGGRLVDIEAVPGEPYSFYVAYASGGIWKTTNNGVTFDPLFDEEPCLIIGDLAIDPSNKNTLWVGTGENNSSRSSYGGMGLFRSDDGGKTWTYAGLAASDRIGRIVVHPHDSNTVFVAAIGPLYTPGGQRGVFRTTDRGKTWKRILKIDDETGVIDLVMDPSDPKILYAAAWQRIRRPWNLDEGGLGSGIWKSTDGGDTWQRLSGGFPEGEHVGRIGLCIPPTRPRTIFAMVDNQKILPEEEWDLGSDPVNVKRLRKMTRDEFLEQDAKDVDKFLRDNDIDPDLTGEKVLEQVKNDEIEIEDLLKLCMDANADLFRTDIHGIEVWRSDDAGETWCRTHDDSLMELTYTYGYYFGQIRVAPHDPDRLYLLGVPLLVSDDGGNTFSRRDQRNVHLDQQAMWIDPAFPNRIVLGNDGGLNMTYDNGKNWLKLNSTCVGQFYTVFTDDAKPYNIYGGLQDNGVLKGPSDWRPGNKPWKLLTGGDGMYVQVDPRDGKTTYMGTQFGHYTRIDAKGEQKSIGPRHKLNAPPLRCNWCTPILLSSFNADILYFGTQKLFRSMDKGETWTAISNDLTTTKERGNVPFGTITTISESPLRFGLIWVGTDDGHVHVTNDGGVEWREVSDRLPHVPIGLWVTRVEASHHDEKTAYVSLSGYREDDIASYLFRTEDLGETWTSLSAGLPPEPVNVIREDPDHDHILYAGTDRGAYVSLDQGGTWHALSGGLPNVPVHDLALQAREGDLVAGTHGRSVWVLDVSSIRTLTDEIRNSALHLFTIDEIKERSSWKDKRLPWKDERRPASTKKITFWSLKPETVRISILEEGGRTLFTDEVETYAGLNRYDWDFHLQWAATAGSEDVENANEGKVGEKGTGAGKIDTEGKDDTEENAKVEGKDDAVKNGESDNKKKIAEEGANRAQPTEAPTLEAYSSLTDTRSLPYVSAGTYTLRMEITGDGTRCENEFAVKEAE